LTALNRPAEAKVSILQCFSLKLGISTTQGKSMPLVWIGLVLVLAKWLELGPFANLSWWWVLAPLAAAILWFEALQPMMGMDRKKEDRKAAAQKKARIAQAFVVKKSPQSK
jgi:small Trp-rich protein